MALLQNSVDVLAVGVVAAGQVFGDRNQASAHICLPAYFFFAHLAAAAFLAIALRCVGVSALARACPPTRPAIRPISDCLSGDKTAARRLASATAAGFLCFATCPA